MLSPLQHVPGKAGGEEDPIEPSRDARRDRTNRIQLAWITSLLSTVTTVAIQLLAIPLVYRSLAESGYAAYASITAAAGVIGVLNLGVGGSLVTPLAAAAAEGDERTPGGAGSGRPGARDCALPDRDGGASSSRCIAAPQNPFRKGQRRQCSGSARCDLDRGYSCSRIHSSVID